ncbi:erythromycin esterase family protein [Streptomyces sp. NPDC020996]|uniref:erythromycin esterase family protein n=1 Tax=Streptomyces sp. NPDC020996 TaxID=3154791 RepID=UPI0033F33ABA
MRRARTARNSTGPDRPARPGHRAEHPFLRLRQQDQSARQDLYRDEQMAANLTWWYEHRGSRTVLAAHDGAVALVSNSPACPRPQGAFLRDRLGAGYLSVRTGFGEGSFVAYDRLSPLQPRPPRMFTVGLPARGTRSPSGCPPGAPTSTSWISCPTRTTCWTCAPSGNPPGSG